MSQFSDTLSPFGGKVSAWAVWRKFPGRKLELFDRDKLSTFSPVAALKRLFWLCTGWISLQNGAVCRRFSRMKISFLVRLLWRLFWCISKSQDLPLKLCNSRGISLSISLLFVYNLFKGGSIEVRSQAVSTYHKEIVYQLIICFLLFINWSVIYWSTARSKASSQ